MRENPLVSVIIPTYNSEKYIRECLDATISQTYGNIEIIIVDNMSSDNTVRICKDYALIDERIKIIENPQKGVSYSRNLGMTHACGEFVVFFDSDDYPEKALIDWFISAVKLW